MPTAVSSRAAAPSSGLKKGRVANPATGAPSAPAPSKAPVSGRRATVNNNNSTATPASARKTSATTTSAPPSKLPPRNSSGPQNAPVSGRRATGAAGGSGASGSAGGESSVKASFSTASPSNSVPPSPAVDFLSTTEDHGHEVQSFGASTNSLGATTASLAETGASVFADEKGSGSSPQEPSPQRSDTPEFLKGNPSPASAIKKGSSDSSSSKSVDEKVQDMMASVEKQWGLVRRQSSIGSPSDEELRKLEEQRKTMEACKLKAAKDVQSWGTRLQFEDPEAIEEQFFDFVDRLVLETDGRGGNLPLVEACLTRFASAVNFPQQISERQWLINSAADGSMGYVKLFLEVPDITSVMEMDTPELVATCSYNQSCRIPLMRLLLDYEKVLRFEELKDDLEDYFNEFFADVASAKKAIPREDRTGRMELLTKLLAHPHINIKLEEESGDGMSIFTRAAAEGDDDVLQLLLGKRGRIKDINASGSDDCTALVHATFGNHVFCVRLLLSQKGIKTTHKSPEGTALEIAKALKRHPEIIAALETH